MRILQSLALLALGFVSTFFLIVETSSGARSSVESTLRLDMAPSTWRSHALMVDCDVFLTGVARPLIREGYFPDDLQRCAELAIDATKGRPTQGYAWYVHAIAMSLDGQDEVARQSLRRSQQITPKESWLTPRRLLWYPDIFKPEDLPLEAGFWSDARIALRYQESRRVLARLYVLHPVLRDGFDTALSDTPGSKALLAEINQVLQEGVK